MDVVAWSALALGFASALAILVDELARGHRQPMWVMNIVHPVTALYLGPVWLWAYARHARRSDRSPSEAWQVGSAVSHCGAGCTLGDIGGEWLLFAIGAAGAFGWEVLADFVLAWTLGIGFQYFTGQGTVWQAIKVDTASILAFQVGLFGWMALSHFVLFQPPLQVDTSGHWFMMQVGMIVGFGTAWPVNRVLVRRGVKHAM